MPLVDTTRCAGKAECANAAAQVLVIARHDGIPEYHVAPSASSSAAISKCATPGPSFSRPTRLAGTASRNFSPSHATLVDRARSRSVAFVESHVGMIGVVHRGAARVHEAA